MSEPIPVVPGADLFITRRTLDRRFFLRPDPVVNGILRYALAVAAERHRIRLYVNTCLSNHHHTVLNDPLGLYPEFARDFHSWAARSLNRHWGRSEALWTPGGLNALLLKGEDALLDRVAYAWANASTSHLTEEPEDWPGVRTRLADLTGNSRLVHKPATFFDPAGTMPDVVELRFVKPELLDDWSDDEYHDEVARHVESKCRSARQLRRARGFTVVGRTGILQQSPFDCPGTVEPRRQLRPRVACLDRALRIAMVLWLKTFRAVHRVARIAFEKGDRDVAFPFGTYLHRRRYGVDCSAVGPPPVTA